MSQLIELLSGAASFQPRGCCLPSLAALAPMQVVAHGVTAVACASISAAILVALRRRPDAEHRGVAMLFALLVLACGTTYLVDVIGLWQPAHGLEIVFELATAVTAATIALMLWRILPRLVALPSSTELRRTNAALEAEIGRRRAAEAELQVARDRLEERIHERTRELEAANAALRRSQDRLALALEAADAGLVEIDLRAGIATHSPRARQILGLPADAPNSALRDAVAPMDPSDRDELMAGLGSLERGAVAKLHSEHRRRHRDGQQVWVDLALKAVERDDRGAATRAVGLCADITSRKKAERRLTQLAMHDALTGLPNRLLFRDMLQREQARVARLGGRFALLLADLNGFKAVNDRFGHAAGDALLTELARRLAECVRASDVVARLSGDEFAILAGEPSNDAALQALAARLVAAVEEPFVIDGRTVQVGVSVGAAVSPDDGRDLDLLFSRADLALYAVKAEGRSGMRRFKAAMTGQARSTTGWMTGLARAFGT
jgi:diguanylate cyclase (GGDEF)-like protein/PAS domain S-box-containing protein